ncbi:shikimate kinase, chloroplastic-like isoform X2 [Actinidia eriantha]|uniref:shikimate kinase, chloroplastic-like isoform X2 n=1 Tax=Actinidia eriantha TaxID=165200 RepID=UPI00258B360E|nr:shikimate kinase, chloroplastic-like isoform X2 [Actinidia eriantha]XP_057492026.1 shikimate kinase, chloroplastic-like isoform X2 [Actinidia eriantha]
MEAKLAQSLQFSTWIESEKMVWKPSRPLQFSPRSRERMKLQVLTYRHLHKPVTSKVSCSYRNFPVLQSGSFPACFDEAMVLKNKSEDIEPYLDGRCIYLVGMMGSGKTTVGRILSDILSYSFFDSDTLIEQAVGATSVAEIFKLHGESFFRDNETDVLRKLSLMQRLVVSTGGGAVIRPINWKYMQKGISVWLDVPLEALARRIAAVGTESRPLLHQESGDAYAKAFTRLSTLWEERSEAYANASTRVSLESMISCNPFVLFFPPFWYNPFVIFSPCYCLIDSEGFIVLCLKILYANYLSN